MKKWTGGFKLQLRLITLQIDFKSYIKLVFFCLGVLQVKVYQVVYLQA